MQKIILNISCNDMEMVDINDIIYFEKENKKIKIVFRNSTRASYCTLSIKNLQTLLDNQKLYNIIFFRPHCSFIVNIKYIKEIKGKKILMSNKDCIPISDKYKTDFMNNVVDNCITLF